MVLESCKNMRAYAIFDITNTVFIAAVAVAQTIAIYLQGYYTFCVSYVRACSDVGEPFSHLYVYK